MTMNLKHYVALIVLVKLLVLWVITLDESMFTKLQFITAPTSLTNRREVSTVNQNTPTSEYIRQTQQPTLLEPRWTSSPQSSGICQKNAIVYMAQKRHSSYDRDSLGLLKRSLELLYRNYLNEQHANNTNVIIFYTGDFDSNDVRELEGTVKTKGLLHLVDLLNTSYWEIPEWLRDDNQNNWEAFSEFSVGYRHMIRWYAVKLWDFFRDLTLNHGCDYQYVMRMDEESFIHSKIRYNLFDNMTANSYVYGFRSCSHELKRILPVWNDYKANHTIRPNRPLQRKLCGFYNNWFIGNVTFFLSPQVQDWLRHADQLGIIYRDRVNDLLIQAAAVYAFAPTHQIHRFLDFTYEHFTLYPSECPMWGSLIVGYNDPHGTETVDKFVAQLQNKGCSKRRRRERYRFQVSNLSASDLSPSYHHLPQELLTMTFRVVHAGKVDIPGYRLMSG